MIVCERGETGYGQGAKPVATFFTRSAGTLHTVFTKACQNVPNKAKNKGEFKCKRNGR